MMKLYEYQGKEIFGNAGIPVPRGFLVHSPQDVDERPEVFDLPVMLKAQVLAGKRGKAGLIQKYSDWTQIRDTVDEWIGKEFSGKKIQSVLIEELLDIERELYVAITVDAASACPLMMVCGEGGMEIEELSVARPEAIVTEKIHVFRGLLPYQIRDMVQTIGLQGATANAASKLFFNLYRIFRSLDAELVEINPLVVDGKGNLWAADAKVRIDDNGLLRHKEYKKGREQFDDDIEYEAYQNGLSYVGLGGNIGVICTGAGLTMTTLDLIKLNGGRPANFLDFGGANYKNAANALRTALAIPGLKVLLLVTFGLFARADTIAEGLVPAVKELKPQVPIIMAVRGTGEERAREMIEAIGIKTYNDTEGAVRKAVELAEA
jgi:succinyl-CoA synthetase beta subunit